MTHARVPLAGFVIVIVVWAASTQLGQIVPHIDCSTRSGWTLVFSAVAILTASAATVIAIRTAWAMRGDGMTDASIMISLASAPFLFAIVMQGAASMLINPCQS